MKKQYTKKQITEAIAHWEKILENMNESEDMIDENFGILRCSARDMIYEDSECLGSDVDVEELYFSRFGMRSRLPVIPNEKETASIKKLQEKDADGYRVIAYIYSGRTISDSKWVYANDCIEDKVDYLEYIDPESENNKKWPDEYDEEFAKEFPTYEKWLKYNQQSAIKSFKQILEDSGKLHYEYAAKNINIDENGTVYTLIVWRS